MIENGRSFRPFHEGGSICSIGRQKPFTNNPKEFGWQKSVGGAFQPFAGQ